MDLQGPPLSLVTGICFMMTVSYSFVGKWCCWGERGTWRKLKM